MEQIDIVKRMRQIGDKFSQLALDSPSVKTARNAFIIAERAYTFVMRNNSGVDYGDLLVQFLSGIETQIRRSHAYIEYCKYCYDNDSRPLQKGEFFRRVKLLDYGVREIGGNHMLTPPGKKYLRRRQSKVREVKQIIDASFSSVEEEDDQNK